MQNTLHLWRYSIQRKSPICEPTTILALSSLAIGTAGGIQQANAQEDALEASATAAAEEQGARLQQQTSERVAEARRNRASLSVAAGEAGVADSSRSFQAQIQQSFARQNRDLGVIQTNAQFAQRGIQTRADASAANIRSGLQIAGQAAGGAAGILANRPAGS